MKKRPFPTGPDFRREFAETSRPSGDTVEPLDPSEIAELDDHLDLSERAPSPGGDLEYAVHRAVSIQKRSAYRQEHGPPPEVAIPRQIDRQFEDAANREAVEHDLREQREERVEESIRREDALREEATAQRALREALAQDPPATIGAAAERHRRIESELKRDWRYLADMHEPEKDEGMLRGRIAERRQDREAQRTPEHEAEIDGVHDDVGRDFTRSSSETDAQDKEEVPYELRHSPHARDGASPAELRAHIDEQLRTLRDDFSRSSEIGCDRDPGRELDR